MLCELCKANSATFHSVDVGDDLCHECWQLLNKAQRIKTSYPNLAQIHDSLKTYETQMKSIPKLTKKSFESALKVRSPHKMAFLKKLCEISARFIFEEVQKQHSKNSIRLGLIQDCNQELFYQAESFTRRAQSYTPKAYSLWCGILKCIVRESIEKHNARKS